MASQGSHLQAPSVGPHQVQAALLLAASRWLAAAPPPIALLAGRPDLLSLVQAAGTAAPGHPCQPPASPLGARELPGPLAPQLPGPLAQGEADGADTTAEVSKAV